MDADLLATLSFPRVRAALADRAATRFGREAAEALAPCDDPAVAAARLDRVAEIQALGELPLGGIEDVREAVDAARDGRMLEGDVIVQVAYTLDAVEHLRRAAAQREQPQLGAVAAGMGMFDGWLRTVREQVDGEGRVRDDATPKLRDVRRRLRPLRGRIRSALEALLERHASAVQDPIVTLRRDRYVIPIRAEAQGQVPGIAVDASDSGKTVFVEPQSVVAMNNELALLMVEERDEVRRILFELGRALAAHPDLDATFEAVATLDVASATARLAEDWGLVRAEAGEDGRLELPAARHPLVEGCVANDVALDEARRLMVITGPNAGGKTVLLKTLGVAVAMAQAGLPVAAGVEGRPPRLPWFARVRADIGDEQSIEASLSTYAGHLTRLGVILAEADAETLVLIDELGSGTDPDEGASLSQAILERVVASGAKGLVTTHLAPLKVFASDAAGLRNAAMRFDVDALAPTFELVVGQPGRSYALAIAERLGLPDAVLARAAALLGPEGGRLERLLEALEDQRESLAASRAEAERDAAAARERAGELEAEIARLRAREDELLAEAAAKAEAQLQATLQRATRLGKTAATDAGGGRSQALEEIRALRREARRDAPRLALFDRGGRR
ncbi:MAG: endonuclease MutS2, partial [Trueperaceae bacterium]|nr:endonuclease MutS2 [Trueperaceae bacterium]